MSWVRAASAPLQTAAHSPEKRRKLGRMNLPKQLFLKGRADLQHVTRRSRLQTKQLNRVRGEQWRAKRPFIHPDAQLRPTKSPGGNRAERTPTRAHTTPGPLSPCLVCCLLILQGLMSVPDHVDLPWKLLTVQGLTPAVCLLITTLRSGLPWRPRG